MDRSPTPALRLLATVVGILLNVVVVYAVASVLFMAQDRLLRR